MWPDKIDNIMLPKISRTLDALLLVNLSGQSSMKSSNNFDVFKNSIKKEVVLAALLQRWDPIRHAIFPHKCRLAVVHF